MQDERTEKIDVRDLGIISYEQAWETQRQIHRDVCEGKRPSTILLLEHTPVVTFGKNADPSFLLASPEVLKAQGIDVVKTDRGGEVTGHEPGQLVVYPILRLSDFRLTPRKYVCLLEKAVIDLLASFGVEARTDEINPGVWVDQAKICAVGIRIKERISMHGIALNVSNDLKVFSVMVPCGIAGRQVTSLQALTQAHTGVADIKPLLVDRLLKSLGKMAASE